MKKDKIKNQKSVNFFSGIFLYLRYTCAVPSPPGNTEWYGQGAEKGRRKGEENKSEIFPEKQRFENNNTGGKRMSGGVHRLGHSSFIHAINSIPIITFGGS